jgi:hypothetical protein
MKLIDGTSDDLNIIPFIFIFDNSKMIKPISLSHSHHKDSNKVDARRLLILSEFCITFRGLPTVEKQSVLRIGTGQGQNKCAEGDGS